MEKFAGWDKLPDGQLATLPALGWDLAAFPMNVLVRIPVEDAEGRKGNLQFHLPAHQVDDLAKALQRTAAQALATNDSQPS